MALIGQVETRPTSTTSHATYQVLRSRCLLCGYAGDHVLHTAYTGLDGCKIIPLCDCYATDPAGLLQPIRIIPNDR